MAYDTARSESAFCGVWSFSSVSLLPSHEQRIRTRLIIPETFLDHFLTKRTPRRRARRPLVGTDRLKERPTQNLITA